MPNSNRQRGDYLERQTRKALEAHGWIVTRSAGSLGPADLWAMRNGNTPLMIACKTNGKIGPGERLALVEAARIGGARPLLACNAHDGDKRVRGHVDIHVVRVELVTEAIDRLSTKAEKRRSDDADTP